MKILYTIIALFTCASLSFGQAIEIVAQEDNIDYAGDTVYVSGYDNIMTKTLYFKNVGTTNTFFWSRKVVNSTNQGFTFQLCDDFICYPIPNDSWIGPEKTIENGDSVLFKPQITTGGGAGTATVRYFVLDANQDKIDSLTVMFSSTASTEKEKSLSFSVYPNPTQDLVSFEGEALKNGGTVVFMDALGKEVKRASISSSNHQVNVSALKRGVYFVNIIDQSGSKSTVQRLIKQ
nr:T9SS type A sorting domain-containing protein [uncultured Brumimicrobium sp.]